MESYRELRDRQQKEFNELPLVICRRCKKPEYWGEMRWLSGFCVCRDCYKAQWESENHKPYTWDDLDGKRPTMEEFEKENE